MKVNLNKHKEFNDKISTNVYQCLELLSLISCGYEISAIDISLLKIIKTMTIDIGNRFMDDKMKSSIYYIRLCNIIESLLEEYKDRNEDFKKSIIDYYIQSNAMKEMNIIGLGWYYDMKFKKHTTTLYSVGYGKESNWHECIKKRYNECNQLKENGIQLIFHACKEHINRGGEIRLKSLSKCLGIDIFKYMNLDKKGIADLYVIKDATVNFIEYEENRISLQEYLLLSNKFSSFDIDKKPNFCLDISHPRNYKLENYNKWSGKFLTEHFISKAEVEERKKDIIIGSSIDDNLILDCLINEHIVGGNRGISSRISPIADKEVVASDTLWKIEENIMQNDNINMLSDKCYHFALNELEYYHLIFSYFKTYYEKKYNEEESFENRYKNQIEIDNNEIDNNISKLEFENEKYLLKEEIDNKKIINNKLLIEFYKSYKASIEAINLNDISAKVKCILSFVDWKIENIPKNWDLKNIYIKQNTEKNLKLNLYKYLCKIIVLNK